MVAAEKRCGCRHGFGVPHPTFLLHGTVVGGVAVLVAGQREQGLRILAGLGLLRTRGGGGDMRVAHN